MSRRVPFRQSDLVRALKCAALAGVPIAKVEIDPSGKIVLLIGAGVLEPDDTGVNEWDEVLAI